MKQEDGLVGVGGLRVENGERWRREEEEEGEEMGGGIYSWGGKHPHELGFSIKCPIHLPISPQKTQTWGSKGNQMC